MMTKTAVAAVAAMAARMRAMQLKKQQRRRSARRNRPAHWRCTLTCRQPAQAERSFARSASIFLTHIKLSRNIVDSQDFFSFYIFASIKSSCYVISLIILGSKCRAAKVGPQMSHSVATYTPSRESAAAAVRRHSRAPTSASNCLCVALDRYENRTVKRCARRRARK